MPGPPLLEAMIEGGPAETYAAHAVAQLVPKDNLLVVSWQLDVPLAFAKKWAVAALAAEGLRAHAITRARRVLRSYFEASAPEVPLALVAATLGGWGALLESGRIESVLFVGNRPWAKAATDRIDEVNRRLELALIPAGRRVMVTTLDD